MKTITMFKLSILILVASITGCAFDMNKDDKVTAATDIKIGVQLWSVRDKLKEDFKATIEALADMGFDAVETAGVFGEFADDPEGLKQYLASKGLVVSGSHVSFDNLSEANREKTFDFYRKIGANYLIIPWDERAWSETQIDEFVADLNRIYPLVKAAGFEFGFHNHDLEFSTFKHHTFWDHIAMNTDPEMTLQLDVGWVNFVGKDPVRFVKAYKGRTLTTHLKVRTYKGNHQIEQHSASPMIGDDSYDWANLVSVMQQVGGTEWFIVEQEEYPAGVSSLQSVAKSKQGLDKILSTR